MIRMPHVRVVAPIAILVIAVSAMAVEDEPDRTPSFPIASEAKAFVARFDRMELLKDDVFVKALEDLAKSKLSPEAKADAFALMQERLGWLFVGAARLFPKQGYAQTMASIESTYFEYQQKMPPDLKVGPLLELARTARGDHPLRASNALLLATILDHKTASDAVRQAIDWRAIAKAPVPAIDLHNLCIAAALSRRPDVMPKLVDLLPEIESEESREDVIAATTIHQDERLRDKLEKFVRDRFPGSFDNSVQTALIVLAQGGPTEHFRTFYKSLGDLTKNEKDIALLRDFWDKGFRDRLEIADPGSGAIKIWDGFTFTLHNEGGLVTWGKNFRYWMSFK